MRIHLLFALGVLFALPMFAHDFEYTYEGQTITYTVLDEEAKTCKTKDGETRNYTLYPGNDVSGRLILPANPEDGNTEYTLTQIGDRSFVGVNLTSVEIPSSVTKTGIYAFANCRNLTSIELPNSVTEICDNSFSGCYGLTSVIIGNSVTSIGVSAFQSCRSLTSVEIPNSVVSIGFSAFERCISLTSVLIGNSVTSIGNGAFSFCSSLTFVSIPNSVNQIGTGAFASCISLESINIVEGNKNYCSVDGILFNFDKSNLLQYPGGKTGSYNIPMSVTSIGNYAFYNCAGLTSVNIGNSVATIGNYAFSECASLTSVNIGNSVTTLGKHAFSYCNELTSITLPRSVSEIGVCAFIGCVSLENINVEKDNTNFCSIDGVLFNFDASDLIQCPAGKTGSYIIPNTVTKIADCAFATCIGLTSVEIPSSVTFIGNEAFSGCLSLTYVDLPNTISEIGNFTFHNCSSLASVTIPYSVTKIGGYAFDFCSALTSVTIPESVTEIGDWAFFGSGLTSVSIPNSITSIGDYAFNCQGLTSVIYNTKTPIECNTNIFANVAYQNAELIVPRGPLAIFQTTEPWNLFQKMTEKDLSGAEDLVMSACNAIDYDKTYDVYKLSGEFLGNQLNTLAPGIYIIRQGDKAEKIVKR